MRGANDTWASIEVPPGALVVNLGGAMERWTNDRWRSTLHLVSIPVRRRRSIAYFHNANWDANIDRIPSCLAPGSARVASRSPAARTS